MRLAVIFLTALFAMPMLYAAPASTSGKIRLPNAIAKQFTRGGALPRWIEPLAQIPATKRTDPVVIRLIETQSLVGAKPAVMLHRAIQVNDRTSLGEIGQFGISFIPAYQKLHLHRVAIHRGGAVMDRTATVDTRLLEQESNVGNGVYGGAATVQLLLEDVRVGDTLVIAYTIEGENPVFSSRWASEFSWDTGFPIELRKLTVLHPKDRPVRWRQLGDYRKEQLQPRLDSFGGLERIRFEGHAIEAIEGEQSIPSDYFPARLLQFSEYSDWQSVARWADGLFPRAQPSVALKALAGQFANHAGAEAKASAALHWVQNQIRYFSVAIGENSHRPQRPDVVLKRRYGDCKDMTYLLISLLAELGIEARPVLLSARAPAIIAKLAPTATWFDHVIVQVMLDGRPYYLDPTRTGQTAQIGMLPAVFPGAAALVVDTGTSSLITLPPQLKPLPEYELQEKLRMPTITGSASLEARRIYRYTSAEMARQLFPKLSARELETNALAEYEKQYPGVKLDAVPVLHDDAKENKFEVVTRYTVTKPASLADGRYSIELDSKVLKGTLALPDKLVRSHPFSMPYGQYRTRYRLAVEWPDNARPSGDSLEKVIDSRYFTLTEYFFGHGNYMDYQIDFLLKQDRIEATELVTLQAETKRLGTLSTALFMSENALLPEALKPYAYRDLDSMVSAARLVNAAKAFKRGAADDLSAEEMCLVSTITLETIDFADGKNVSLISQMVRDMRERAKREGASACLGRVLFAIGSYADAVQVYDSVKGLESGSKDMRLLAWARYYSGDMAGALRGMARFMSAPEKLGAQRSSSDVVSQIALLLLTKQAMPAALRADADATPDAPWPRPLIAMQLGVLSEAALLTRLDGLPADARALALTQAWYYIGQRRVSVGDVEGARTAFRWLRVNGVRSTEEYFQAKAALQRMAPTDANYRAALEAFDRKDLTTGIGRMLTSAEAGLAPAQREIGIALREGSGVAKDATQAMRWLRLAAAQHDGAAANTLGIMYALGEGVTADAKMAASWYRTAAALGDQFAQHNLATRYANGDGVEEDAAKAFEYCRQAAEQGHADAQANLGRYYANGYGVARDATLAMFWARRSSTQGNAEGQFRAGYLSERGIGAEQDFVAARTLYLQAARQGHAVAQYNLARLFERGEGGERNDGAAFEWYEKAAYGGDTDAQLMAGHRLVEGRGVRVDAKKARAWFEKAAEAGSANAQHELAIMYDQGLGGPKDLDKALIVLRSAADQGNVQSMAKLGLMYASGSGFPKDPAQAASWYQRAMEAGSALAGNNLGDMYENGIGVKQDYARAVSLYRQSARSGFSTAFLSLATLYEAGKGLPRDPALAYTYYRLAARASDNDYPDAVKRVIAMRELSAAQLKKVDDAADQWMRGQPLPGEQSVAESFDAAHMKLKAQKNDAQSASYAQQWSEYDERQGLAGKGGCSSKPYGRVRLILLLDEAGVVRHVAAESDDEMSRCYQALYLNLRFPAPPAADYRTMVTIN